MRPGEHKIEISLDPTIKKTFDYELQWSLEDGLKQYLITKNSLNKAINKSVTLKLQFILQTTITVSI